MTSFRIRPRFQVVVPDEPAAIVEKLAAAIAQPDSPCTGRAIPGHAVLTMPAEAQHFWSPQLDLSIEAHPEGALIRGLYGPNPEVWLLFAFGYGITGVLALFISIFGFTRVSLGMEAPILWILPVLGGLAVALYIASQLGQKLGAEQTFTLHHFFEKTVAAKVPVM